MDTMPQESGPIPKVPNGRRFDFLKGGAIGLVPLGAMWSLVLGSSSVMVAVSVGALTIGGAVVLFYKRRTRMAWGLLTVMVGVPLLLVGACFSLFALGGL